MIQSAYSFDGEILNYLIAGGDLPLYDKISYSFISASRRYLPFPSSSIIKKKFVFLFGIII